MLFNSLLAETANQQLFLFINAPAHASSLMLAAGQLCASYLIFLFPLVAAVYWFGREHHQQQRAFQAGVNALIALSGNMVIGLLWQHPRPFMLPVGHTFLNHVADSSFPSDHMTLACAITFTFLSAKYYKTGAVLTLFCLAVAWGRIYMGVHFPVDMLGSLLVAMVSVWLGNKLQQPLMPLFAKCIRLNHYLFSFLRTRQSGQR